MKTEIAVIAKAQELPAKHIYDMGFMELSQPGNFIEYDGYNNSFGKRPHNKGQLPPGCASVAFTVENLDNLKLEFVGKT